MSLEKYLQEGFTCYLVASSDYDDSLHIYKADDIDYYFRLPRDVQPHIINVFDICFDNSDNLLILSMRDDEFIIDQINCVHHHNEKLA
jgi:hypothetical protein